MNGDLPSGRSYSRLARLRPDELDADQRALYASITEGPRARGHQAFALTDSEGGLEGPFNAMLLSPALGSSLQALGSTIRYGTGLPDRAREIAILVVSHRWDSEFERYAHEAVARTIGLAPAELDALARHEYEAFTDALERSVIATTRALVTRGDLSEAEYESAVVSLGAPLLFELTTLVGYYTTLALQLRVFGVTAPPGGDVSGLPG